MRRTVAASQVFPKHCFGKHRDAINPCHVRVSWWSVAPFTLKVYERFAKIRPGKDGRYRISHPRIAQQYRLNVGTIVEETMIKVRLVRSGREAPVAGRGPTGARCT